MISEWLTCYFSVMRYVPDVVRDESINVGVVLFEPQSRLLLMRRLRGLARVQRFDPNVNRKWFERHLASFQEACERVSGQPSSASGNMDDWTKAADPLQTLHQQFCNLIQFTAPRPVLTPDPQAEIERLYVRYVSPREGPKKEYWHDPQLRRRVKEVLAGHQLLAEGRVQTDYEAEVRGDVLTFPFYYRNGRLNFLEPISFAVENQNEKQDEVRRLLYKHFLLREAPDHRDAHLLVVAHPPLNGEPRDQEKFQRCLRMLSENEVETQIVERDQEESWRRLVEHVKSDLGVRD